MASQTLNIALPKELVKRVDERAKREYKNRSELIREALRIYLSRVEGWEHLFEYGQKIGKKMGIKREKDVDRIVEEYRHSGR